MAIEQAKGQQEGVPQEQPEMSAKDEAYVGGLMKLLHSRQTSGNIVGMLKSAPPEKSIPQAALTIFQQYDKQVSSKSGSQTPLETKLIGGVYLVGDLIEIGNASAAFERQLTQEDFQPLLQETMQPYIHQGLKDGSIDPVELQAALEPLMDDQQLAQGMQAAEATGTPLVAGQAAAMETYASQRERRAVNKASNQAAGKNAQQARGQMLQGGQ